MQYGIVDGILRGKSTLYPVANNRALLLASGANCATLTGRG